ncbi:MAG: hypothetical protein H0X13_17980 [Ramlibacter sp.]|nr:hypothetical protein [Ramlibacter sp.]
MNRLLSPKSFAAAAVVMGVFAAASAAHARSDVYFSIGLQSPGVYVQPQPVYVQPQPVYVQPQPVYVQPQPVYVQPRPVYIAPQPVYTPAPDYHSRHDGGRRDDASWERRGPYGDRDRDGIANVYDTDPRGNGHQARRFGPYGDLDGDGIMNMDDRDRDGDGVRNRHDRFPDDPFRY